MSNRQEQIEGSSDSAHTPQVIDGTGSSAAVDRHSSMFKDYLEKTLEDKGKQIAHTSKIDKKL